MAASGTVVAVCCSPGNGFSKPGVREIRLVEGLGVEGDAHSGRTVQHLYLRNKDAAAPNLRQVHLMHAELFAELAGGGFTLEPGDLGENITACGIDLLSLPVGAVLEIGEARIELTGRRTPCVQIENFQKGLLKALIAKDGAGQPVFKAGVMGVVRASGRVRNDDEIDVQMPVKPHKPLLAI